jgi:dihydrofolate synthase / folylpolyglutamate synthase
MTMSLNVDVGVSLPRISDSTLDRGAGRRATTSWYVIIYGMGNPSASATSADPIELLDRLSSPSRLGQRPGLDTIRGMLLDLGNPQDSLPIVHIGGTSGKGSTATIAASVLSAAGYRVGLHVKPHLERIEERFVVDGQAIPTDRLVALIRQIEPIARRWRPSWYELTVALAFEHFRAERVEVAVVEVGLGGTYDATNVVRPAVAVLTNVGLDHVDVLGNTVELIAADKVGIFKPDAPTVCGATQDSVRAIARRRCNDVASPLWLIDEDYSYQIVDIDDHGSRFDLRLPSRCLSDLTLKPLGAHQVANASTAVAACEALVARGITASSGAIRQALSSTSVPGRLAVLGGDPLLVLDGGHNPAKMAALGAALAAIFSNRPVVGVLAFKRGHDLVATLHEIVPYLDSAVLTTFDATTDFGRGQAVDPAEIEAALALSGVELPCTIVPDPVQAVKLAMSTTEAGRVVCVAGSLYLVGVIRAHFAD